MSDRLESPLVSLVMAAWQPRPDWIRAAVESALTQGGCDLELIVVDDGSPEPVANLLAGVADERLRIVRAPHGGECAARNRGIVEARGTYLRLVDADDLLERGSTARLLELAGGRDDVIAYGATCVCDADLRPLWRMASSVTGDAVDDCLLGRFTVRVFSMLFPRRIVELAGEWDPAFRLGGDWDFVLRALEHAQVRGERRTATFYRKHPAAATTDVAAGEAGARRVVDKYFERHPERRGTRFERRVEARLAAIAARVLFSRGRRREGFARLRRALRLDPLSVHPEVLQGLPALMGAARRFRRRLPLATER